MTIPEQLSKKEKITNPPITDKKVVIPPQYRDMPSELVAELMQSPVYIDPQKNQHESERVISSTWNIRY